VRKELAAIGGTQVESCPTFLVVLTDLSRVKRVSAAEGVMLEAVPFFESYLVAAVDAAIAAQTTAIAAESLGLSTIYAGAMRNDVTLISELLSLPAGVVPVTDQRPHRAAELSSCAVAHVDRSIVLQPPLRRIMLHDHRCCIPAPSRWRRGASFLIRWAQVIDADYVYGPGVRCNGLSLKRSGCFVQV
jgi:nitroreductase